MKDLEKEFKPSSWAIDNKTAVYFLVFFIAVLGMVSYNNLPKENFPDIVVPKIFITTSYLGQSPQNIETLVTRQIEKRLKSLKGLKKVTSNTQQNVSIITAEFNTDVKIRDAKQDVKDAVDKATPDLPQGDLNLKQSVISDVDVADIPILYVNVSGDYDLKKLKEYADNMKDEIESYKEISEVKEVGALTPNIQINVDMNKMAAAQITFFDITDAIGKENIISSVGAVKIDGVQRVIDIKQDFKNADQVAAMVIRNPSGKGVYLRDIAEIKDGFKDQESYARLYGKNVITLVVTKRAGENLIAASDKIQTMIAQKEKTVFPKGLTINVTGDQSEKTRATLHDLINTIVIGFILVTVILMFFMGVSNGDICGTIGAPIMFYSIFGNAIVAGFTLNMIVLFSFLLALGIVVDDAIVVIENTHRIFGNGKIPIKKAAKMAAGEVFMPVFSGTMTTLAPFVPLAFWNSIIGHFMFFLPITLIITLLASLVVAYIINPVFAVDFMKPHVKGEHDNPRFDRRVVRTLLFFAAAAVLGYLMNRGIGNLVVFVAFLYLLNHFVLLRAVDRFQKNAWPKFQSWYAGVLEKAVKRPVIILVSIIVLFAITFGFMLVFPPKIEFFPSGDPNFVNVYITLPVGTDQDYTNEVTKKLEDQVIKITRPDKDIISSIVSNVSVSVTDPQDEDQGIYYNKGKITIAFVEFE